MLLVLLGGSLYVDIAMTEGGPNLSDKTVIVFLAAVPDLGVEHHVPRKRMLNVLEHHNVVVRVARRRESVIHQEVVVAPLAVAHGRLVPGRQRLRRRERDRA